MKHYLNAVVAERPSCRSSPRRCSKHGGRWTDVLKAIALHLDLEEDYFEAYVPGGNSILRLIHYPPILKNQVQRPRRSA